MKKILYIIIVITFLVTSTDTVYANKINVDQKDVHNINHEEYNDADNEKRSFKIADLSVVKYGKYLIPIHFLEQGLEATVTLDKKTANLKIVKYNTTILINLKNETITVNGIADTNTGIFTAKWNHKTLALIQYIADVLGSIIDIGDDEIVVISHTEKLPTNIIITPVGTTVVANTLNTTTLFMNVTAKIEAGQATGRKAELYVGSKLIATDSNISATDTKYRSLLRMGHQPMLNFRQLYLRVV